MPKATQAFVQQPQLAIDWMIPKSDMIVSEKDQFKYNHYLTLKK